MVSDVRMWTWLRTIAVPLALSFGMACGPSGPAASGSDGTSAGETSDTGETELPTLQWETIATTCGTAEAVTELPGDAIVVAGSRGIISGWLRRYDANGDELWLAQGNDPFVALDWGPTDDSLWVAASQWGGSASIAAYDLDGQVLADAPVLAVSDDTRLMAVAKLDASWLVGGRVGPYPEDAWLIEVDALGQTVTTFETPVGDGNVASQVRSIASDAGLAAACGTAGAGEWGFPWLLILDGEQQHELTGAGNDGLGVRACIDVALAGDRIARAERGESDTLVITDAAGLEQWSTTDEGIGAVAFTANGDVISAGNEWLRRRSANGELIWTIPIEIPELSVRDIVALDSGAIVVIGNLPGDVGECAQAWIGRYF